MSTFERRWNGLLAVGVATHHSLRDRELSVYDICDRLVPVHDALMLEPKVELESSSVMNVNDNIADALGQSKGEFLDDPTWQSLLSMIDDCGGFTEDPAHMSGWIFSSLYWDHLSVCHFATAWFFTDALRVMHELPQLQLPTDDLGPFLRSLSGAGPPLNDGQTFFPDRYSFKNGG